MSERRRFRFSPLRILSAAAALLMLSASLCAAEVRIGFVETAEPGFFMKGEREPGRTRAYRRPRYMFIVPSVATSARLTCRNQYGTRTRIHDSLVGEFDGVLFNCLLKVPDNFLHTVSMQSVSFPWAV